MQYYVQGSDGKDYGPCDFATLAQWAQDDRIRPESQVKEFETGRVLRAVEIPGLFVPAAGPVMPAGQSPYDRGMNAQPVRNDNGVSVFWAFADPTLAVILFFFLHGIGLIFGAFGVYYAIRLFSSKHKLGIFALVYSIACLAAVIIGWILRVNNG